MDREAFFVVDALSVIKLKLLINKTIYY